MSEKSDYDPESLPDLLPIYYRRLFPYGPYYRWLNYGGVPKSYFTHREFSFTLKDDIYLRYQSFADQQELEKEIQKRCPYKMDIGAVFSHRPKDQKTVKAAAFQPQEKELVFDIDMTDYDDVRYCCSGADICKKCWPLMVMAVKIIDTALREDFGFDHLLWVFSGRRGIHCWACDEQARKLSQNGRSAIAEYLSVVKGGENQTKKVHIHEQNVHPSIERALQIIREHFETYACQNQEFLLNDDRIKKVLALIADDTARDAIQEDLERLGEISSKDRFKVIDHDIRKFKNESGKTRKISMAIEEIMLQYCYPRLDVNVSKGVNHLLKSPFCIHPKTGKVCVPMDPAKIDSFDPFNVPTISEICNELNDIEIEKTSGDEEKSKRRPRDYKKTSLRESVEVFDNFLQKLEQSWKGKKIEYNDQKKEF